MTTTPTGFTDLERQTLVALWDREAEWWEFLRLLQDRFIEEGDEDGARFIRWYHGWGRRGVKNNGTEGGPEHFSKWYVWTAGEERVVRRWLLYPPPDDYRWLLPPVFLPVCAGCFAIGRLRVNNFHDSPIGPTEAALGHWRTLDEAEKVDLETNWRGK